MIATLLQSLDSLLGLHVPGAELSFGPMAARTVVVFVFGIALMRFADRRSLGRNAGFDMLLMVILGSVISRGINGQAPFFPTLGAGIVLVALHRLCSAWAFHSHRFSEWIKGGPKVLIAQGQRQTDELRQNHITVDDLEENLRINGNVSHPSEVAEARLERNGEISVIRKA